MIRSQHPHAEEYFDNIGDTYMTRSSQDGDRTCKVSRTHHQSWLGGHWQKHSRIMVTIANPAEAASANRVIPSSIENVSPYPQTTISLRDVLAWDGVTCKPCPRLTQSKGVDHNHPHVHAQRHEDACRGRESNADGGDLDAIRRRPRRSIVSP